jgi:ubiquinone/menaquinone biosynthesis C-methylase UbiE
MSQFEKPTGFLGEIIAKGMACGHRDFYKYTAYALELKQEDTYLEIGFGSGLFIKKYASHVSQISGLDYSEDMVRLASSINKKLVASGIAEFKQGKSNSLPWNDNVFSKAALIETFFFLQEPEVSLKEIYRVLMPGGKLAIEMAYNKDYGIEHTKHIKKMKLRLYSSIEMKTMLENSGFKHIDFDYFQGLWLPVKGYIVPKGMVVKAMK